ncbi:MAG: thiamine-phosphate kinase [Dehalococcoidia bacterium]|nr:thiamine-phosphate kinase [Dehalococcoidia bacterium]
MIGSVRVSEIGEFGLIKLLARELGVQYLPSPGSKAPPGLLVGLGDDAVVTARQEGALVWTTDTMLAGNHFLPELTAWPDIGWKALAVNVSDIAAMGATPHLALVTLILPEDACVEDVLALYQGLKECAEAYGVTLGGGDIVRGPVFAVTVALSGRADEARAGGPRVMTRSAARTGDVIAVSGYLGDSAGGLRLLQDGADLASAAALYLRLAHERPQPSVSLGRAAVRAGVRCAIDVSDGLVQDLGHIASASAAGIRVEANRIPLSNALHETFPGRALGLALTGGEDYELVLIGPRPAIESLLNHDTTVTEIGQVVEHDGPHVAVVDETGREIPLPHAGGWDHFANP